MRAAIVGKTLKNVGYFGPINGKVEFSNNYGYRYSSFNFSAEDARARRYRCSSLSFFSLAPLIAITRLHDRSSRRI